MIFDISASFFIFTSQHFKATLQNVFVTSSNIILIIFLCFLALGILYILRFYKPQPPILPPVKTNNNSGQFTAKISRPKLVNAIVDWCVQHIGDKQSQPIVQISYHPHRQNYGCYLMDKKLIRIYIKNHKSTESLVLTIIHEFVHFTELQSDKESNNYIRFHKIYGYDTNPYERSANEIAARHYKQCLLDLSAKGFLEARLPLI